MPIDFDRRRWERIRENYRAWWEGSLGRPLIHLTLGGAEPDRRSRICPLTALPPFTTFRSLPRPSSIGGITSSRAVVSSAMVFPLRGLTSVLG